MYNSNAKSQPAGLGQYPNPQGLVPQGLVPQLVTQLPVPDNLDAIKRSLNNLRELRERLSNRLETILQSRPPMPQPCDTAKDVEYKLANHLNAINRDIATECKELSDIIDRLML